MVRSQCVDLGLNIAVACTPLSGQAIKRYAIPNTVSQSWYIGRAVHRARRSKANIIDAIVRPNPMTYSTYTSPEINRNSSKPLPAASYTVVKLSMSNAT